MDEHGAAESGQSGLVCWEIPGLDAVVELAANALNGLLLEALGGLGLLSRGRGVEAGGILLGWTHSDGRLRRIRIEDFRPIACQHAHGPAYVLSEAERGELRRMAAAWGRKPGRTRYFVGYWRSHVRGPLALRESDCELLEELAGSRAEIAILVEPHGAGPGTAAVFLRGADERAPWGLVATYEISPVAAERGRSAGRSRAPRDQQERTPSADQPGETRPSPPAPFRFTMFEAPAEQPAGTRSRRRRWLLAVGLSLLLLGSGAAVAIQKGFLRFPPLRAAGDPYTLGLQVRAVGANLHVTWDPGSQAIRLAEHGLLTIADEDRLQVLELDRRQLLGGSAIYRPVGDRVSFRLELRWGHRGLSEATQWEEAR